MPILSSEIHFRKGLAALADGDAAGATEHFRQAILIERDRNAHRPQMRYISYLGLSMAMTHGATPEAIKACERAAKIDFYNADLQLNLGKVYLLAGKTTRALAAFERGRRLSPDNDSLKTALSQVDRRARPVIPFLKRNHPFNRWLGKVRHALGSRMPFPRLSPRRPITPS